MDTDVRGRPGRAILGAVPTIALALIALEGAARAEDPLAVASQAVNASDYLAARPAVIAALSGGGRSPEELAEIYRLTGIVEGALGDAKAAAEAFTRLLVLSPKATLGTSESPKFRRPFDAASRYLAGHAALEVRIETRANPPVVTLVIASDPLNMVAAAHATFTVDGGPERGKDVDVDVAAERAEIALPPARRIDARIVALDIHGNHLVEIGSREVPIVIIGEPPVVAPVRLPPPRRTAVVVRAEARPLYLRWWPYAAAAAVAAGATGYFAWAARSATDELDGIVAHSDTHPYGDARAVEDRARRDVLLTNIGLGVTGALAVAAGVLYLTTPRDRVETRLAAVPLPGGGALVLGGTL
jgi:hypothetical protein